MTTDESIRQIDQCLSRIYGIIESLAWTEAVKDWDTRHALARGIECMVGAREALLTARECYEMTLAPPSNQETP